MYASFSAAVRRNAISKFENLVEAKQAESGENLVVSIPGDDGVFYLPDNGRENDPRLGCTNAVQTYVDVWHSGSRGQEAAEALLEQRLKPEWKAGGMNP